LKTLVALFGSARPVPWGSARDVGERLRRSWEAAPGIICRRFPLPESTAEARQLIRRLDTFGARQCVVTDHAPHPASLLRALPREVAVSLHVYGNFAAEAHAWKKLEASLLGRPLRWLAPSPKHGALLKGLLMAPAEIVPFPFPVDVHMFRSSGGGRVAVRRALGLKPDDFLFVYAGRISRQKNLALLMRTFLESTARRNPQPVLLLCGRADDLGAPGLGRTELPGQYELELAQRLNARPGASSRVRWLDHRSPADLARILRASDAYVSLSTHHDENFGLAPAEALCTGLPAVLTDWGGFSGFATHPASVELVPVKLSKIGLYLDGDQIARAFHRVASLAFRDRAARARHYRRWLSTDQAAARCAELACLQTPPPFAGFSPLLKRLAARRTPIGPTSRSRDYAELYRPYLKTP
jgi:glycosyltransferase involved in cell wall biosynthesis